MSYTDQTLNQLVINKLSKTKYQELVNNDEVNEDELYLVPDDSGYTAGTGIDITNDTISVDNTIARKSELFSGSYNDLSNKPDLSIYQLASEAFNGDYDSLTNKPDLSIYAESANLATVATTGAYSDLTGTPTIPDTSNMVTTDTTQSITSQKTFTKNLNFNGNGNYYFTFNGRNPIKMIAPRSSTTGFTLYDYNNNEKGYLQYNSQQDGLYLGRYGNSATAEMGFLSESTLNNGYKVLMPNLTVTGSAANNVNYMAISVNNVKADSTGNVTLAIPDVSDYYTKSEVDGLIPTATSDLTNDSGFITGITSSDVTTALGYTPGTSNFDGAYSSLTGTPDLSIYAQSANLATVATTGDYDDLTNKPDLSVYQLASTAFSGDYTDLANKPTLFSGNYNDLSNKPDLSVYQLASTAFSGSYNDLTNKPTIPTVPTNISAFTNDAGYITGITDTMINTALGYTAADAADVPTTASSTSTVTPTTTQLVFTYTDDTTETITLMTGASVSTTTTLS